jgi:hypothetical protein
MIRPVAFLLLVFGAVRGLETIGLLKLQHEDSACQDLHKFLEFKRTYNVSHALQHAKEFFEVRESARRGDSSYKVIYSCKDIFRGKEEKVGVWPPPTWKDLQASNPAYLNDICLNDPAISISDMYRAEKQNNGAGYVWTEPQIDALARVPSTCGSYDQNQCEKAFVKYEPFIRGKVGMVLGSQSPWAEALGFRFGAARIITYEYMKIQNSHPLLTTITPSEAAAKYLAGDFEPVDFIITYSSLEHDGLGRYGDPLNPFGDLESIAKCHCMLKPGGLLFFGVPVGVDEMQYNAHRIYGYRRLSVVLSLGFRLVDMVNHMPFTIQKNNGYTTQPVIVLQKHELHWEQA